MDGSELVCAAHVKGKCSTVKEDEGMEWMGWDGMVRQGERVVRYACGLPLRYKVGQGRAGQGRKEVGGWVVVWAEFELGCTGQKEVGGQEAGAGELGSWGRAGGGQEQGRSRRDSNVAGGTHARTHTHDSDKLLVGRSFVGSWPQGCHGTRNGWYLA